MNIENLTEEQSKFEPYLINSDYTFIGPVDQNLFEPFMKNVNLFAPMKGYRRKIKDFMPDKNAVNKALALLPVGTELRIYTVINKSENILFHSTIEEYCETMKISYP